jgi:PKD repeat protein
MTIRNLRRKPRAPVVAFSASPLSGTAPLTVQFTDASSQSPTSWAWDFENNGTVDSTVQNPVKVYTVPGTYSVKLTATNAGGSGTLTKTAYITVAAVAPPPSPPAPPAAAFSGTPLSGLGSLTTLFADESTGTPTAWSWLFGDGASSTLQNPSHNYAAPGSYGVILTASNAGGSTSLQKAGYVSVAAPATFIVGQTLYVNLPAGMVGTIQIQRDGVDIAGAVSAAGVGSYAYTLVTADDGHTLTPLVTSIAWETTAPRRFSIALTVAEPDTIIVAYDENLNTTAPATSAFTLAGSIATAKTLSTVTIVGNLVKLKYDSRFVPGDQPILSYAVPGSNPIKDLAHTPNSAPAFTSVYVANQFPLPATICTLNSTGSVYSTPGVYSVGGGGFVNNGIGGDLNYAMRPCLAAYGDHQIRLEEDGWIEMRVTDTSAVVRQIGFGGDYVSNMPFAALLASGHVQAKVNGSTVGSPYTFATPGAACRVRLYRAMPTGTVTMDTSEDGGVTWTTRYTFTATNNGELVGTAMTTSSSVAIVGVAVENFIDLGYS